MLTLLCVQGTRSAPARVGSEAPDLVELAIKNGGGRGEMDEALRDLSHGRQRGRPYPHQPVAAARRNHRASAQAVAMRMSGEAAATRDAIVIDDAQDRIAVFERLVIVSERKGMAAIEPFEARASAFRGFP